MDSMFQTTVFREHDVPGQVVPGLEIPRLGISRLGIFRHAIPGLGVPVDLFKVSEYP